MQALAFRALNEMLDVRLYSKRHSFKARLINACMGRTYPNESKRGPEVIKSILKRRLDNLLDTFPCGDKPIGDCTFREVVQQAMLHERLAQGNSEQAQILYAVHRLGKDNEIVRDKVSAKTFSQIVNKVITKAESA